MGNIVIKPGHDPIPATVDAEESLSSSDPDMASLAQDLFYINVEKDPYDPTHKEVITIPVSVRSSLDEGTYYKHRRTLGLDPTVTDKGATAKAVIVIGPAFKDAGLAFAGPVSSGAETYLGFDIKKHAYELKGRDNPHGGTQYGFTLDSSVYKITGDEIIWKTDEATGTIRPGDVGQKAYDALKLYLTTKGADKKPVTIRDTTAFFGFAREQFYWLIAAQAQAYKKLHSEKRITTIPPITLGGMLYVDSGKDSYGLLCLDISKKEIIFPPPDDWQTNDNIELISLYNFETVDKATTGITAGNLLADALMPWLAKENDEGAMVALIRFQFLSGAQSVDIENQTVTFESDGAAYGFVNTLFGVDRRKDLPSAAEVAAVQTPQDMAHLAGARTYTTPGGDGLQFWFFEGAKATTDMRGGKGTDDNAIWSIAAFDDVRYAMEQPLESIHDYAGYFAKQTVPPDGIPRAVGYAPPKGEDRRYQAIALPILTNIETGVTEPYYQDPTYYQKEGIEIVMDNYQMPEGYRLPSEKELYDYTLTMVHRYDVPPKPGFAIPITDEFGKQITVVSDEHMIRLVETGHGNPMPIAFCEPHYQPLTQVQHIGGSVMGKDNKPEKQPGWITMSGRYTYEQAHLLKVLCQQANAANAGFEGSIRRIEFAGFEYETPDGDWWQNVGMVLDQSWLGIPGTDAINWTGTPPLNGVEKTARYACHYNVGSLSAKITEIEELIRTAELNGEYHIILEGEPTSINDAKEIIHGLRLAWKGPVEAFAEWYSRNWEILSTGLVTTCLFLIVLNWKSIRAYFRNLVLTSQAVRLYRQAAYDSGISEHELIGRTAEMRATFEYFLDLSQDSSRQYKYGTLHGVGGVGKTWLIKGMGMALNLGVYPDGTRLDTRIREAFGEVMELNIGKETQTGDNVGVHDAAGAKIRAGIQYARDYRRDTGKICIIFIDEFLQNLIRRGELSTDNQGRQIIVPFMDSIFKQEEDLYAIFGIATRDLHDPTADLRNDEQLTRRGPFIPIPLSDGTQQNFDRGMEDLQPYYVLQVLQEMRDGMIGSDGLHAHYVDVSLIDDEFLKHIITSANRRWPEGDPDRSRSELRQYLTFLVNLARERGAPIQANYENFQAYMRSKPGDPEHENVTHRRPIQHEDFDQPPFRTVGTPQRPDIQKPPKRRGFVRRNVVRTADRVRRRFGGGNNQSIRARRGRRSPPGTSPPPVVSASTRAAVEAAFRGDGSRPGHIVSVAAMSRRGFTEAQMLQLVEHMRSHPNVTLGLYNSQIPGSRPPVLLSPQDILDLLNDPEFMQVAERDYVTPAMVPAILHVYSNGVPPAPAAGTQVVIGTNGRFRAAPMGPPPADAVPASAFLPGAPAYVRVAVGSPPATEPHSDRVSSLTRSTLEAAFRGAVNPGDDIVEILAQRGFTEAQMLQLADHTRVHPNVTVGLLNMTARGPLGDVPLSPQVILQMLNDPGFMQVAGRDYVTPQMVPAIVQIYTNPRAVQRGMYVLPDGQVMLTDTTPPRGAVPASAFLPGAPAYTGPAGPPLRPAAAPPRPLGQSSAAPPRPGMALQTPTQVQAGLRAMLDMPAKNMTEARAVLTYVNTHNNVDADGLCGLMYRQAQVMQSIGVEQGLRISIIEDDQYEMMQATYRIIRRYEGRALPDARTLAAEIQQSFDAALDRFMPTPSNRALAARVEAYKSVAADRATDFALRFLQTQSQQRRH